MANDALCPHPDLLLRWQRRSNSAFGIGVDGSSPRHAGRLPFTTRERTTETDMTQDRVEELAAARDKLRTDQRTRLAAIITDHETRIVEMQEAIAEERRIEK
jgi:hypothetical protein